MDVVEDLPADQLVGAVAVRDLDALADLPHDAVVVAHQDHVAGALGEIVQLPLAEVDQAPHPAGLHQHHEQADRQEPRRSTRTPRPGPATGPCILPLDHAEEHHARGHDDEEQRHRPRSTRTCSRGRTACSARRRPPPSPPPAPYGRSTGPRRAAGTRRGPATPRCSEGAASLTRASAVAISAIVMAASTASAARPTGQADLRIGTTAGPTTHVRIRQNSGEAKVTAKLPASPASP